jgi:hypothetical protein
MIETWADRLCAVWAISDEGFGSVKSYKLIGESDFPDSIDPSDLDLHPIALTVPAMLQPEYSFGGPRIGFYKGVTEFHVSQDLNRARVPSLMKWYGKILRTAAANATLSGLVELFLLDDVEDAIAGPMPLQYGSENPHWGFIVKWKVKEKLNDLVISVGS